MLSTHFPDLSPVKAQRSSVVSSGQSLFSLSSSLTSVEILNPVLNDFMILVSMDSSSISLTPNDLSTPLTPIINWNLFCGAVCLSMRREDSRSFTHSACQRKQTLYLHWPLTSTGVSYLTTLYWRHQVEFKFWFQFRTFRHALTASAPALRPGSFPSSPWFSQLSGWKPSANCWSRVWAEFEGEFTCETPGIPVRFL